MLIEALGQLLEAAKRVKESRWAMPKGYCVASGGLQEYRKAIGKCPNNTDTPWAKLPLALWDKKNP
jgi:hypothetical protein